jgi:hypothetical protein
MLRLKVAKRRRRAGGRAPGQGQPPGSGR